MPIDHALEGRVLAALDKGDVDGAATLALRGYGPEVFGYLVAVLRDETRAGDAFSIFSENLWSGLRAFERQSALRTWAYKIAFGAAMRIVRDPYARRAAALESSRASELAQDIRTATAAHLRTENKDRVRELRAALDEDEQTLLVLRIDRALEWKEVALVMDVEEATLRKRLERVKEKLRKLASERGITFE